MTVSERNHNSMAQFGIGDGGFKGKSELVPICIRTENENDQEIVAMWDSCRLCIPVQGKIQHKFSMRL
jgi:hypothetical protein